MVKIPRKMTSEYHLKAKVQNGKKKAKAELHVTTKHKRSKKAMEENFMINYMMIKMKMKMNMLAVD